MRCDSFRVIMSRMPVAIPTDLRNQAYALFIASVPVSQIASQLGISRDSVRQWCSRYKWQTPRQAVTTTVQRSLSNSVTEALKRDGQEAREALARSVNKQAKALASVESVNAKDLGNTPDGQGLASITKTVAETANVVFGWDKESSGGLLSMSCSRLLDPQEAIDITPCGQDTTTGSNPAAQLQEQIPQVTDDANTQ